MKNLKNNFKFLKSFVLIILLGAICVQIEGVPVLISKANANIAVSAFLYGSKKIAQIPVVFSQDGSLLAAIEQNGAINLREVATGRILWSRFGSQNDSVSGLAFSQDGKTLASFGKNAINLWHVSTGKVHDSISLAEISGTLRHIEFSPDGKSIAGADFKNGLYWWNLETGFANALSNNQGRLEKVPLFSPDSRFLLSVNKSVQSTVKLWDRITGRLHLELPSESEVITAAFSPDAKVLAIVAKDGSIKFWDLVSGALKHSLTVYDNPVKIRFSPDGKYLAGASRAKKSRISLWNALTGQLIFNKLSENGAGVADLVYSQNGRLLASIGRDFRISLWALPGGTITQVLTGLNGKIVKTAFNPEQLFLSAVSKQGQLIVWDLASGIKQQSVQLALSNNSVLNGFQSTDTENTSVSSDPTTQAFTASKSNTQSVSNTTFAFDYKQSPDSDRKALHTKNRNPHNWKGIRAIALSQNGLEMGVAGDDGLLRIFKKHGKERWNVSGHHRRAIVGLAFREQSKEWVTAGLDTEIKLWNDTNGKQIKTFYGPEHPPRALALSPDGQFIATAGEDSRVFIYDAALSQLKTILTGHSDFVNGLAFSPDGTTLASAGADGTILVWDMKSGKINRTLQGHLDEVNSVAFSPDGIVLASASADSKVILWNLSTGKLQNNLESHQGPVRVVAFNLNGNELISAGEDGRVLVWNSQTGKLKKQLEKQAAPVNALALGLAGKLHVATEKSEISEIDIDSGVKLDTMLVPEGSG